MEVNVQTIISYANVEMMNLKVSMIIQITVAVMQLVQKLQMEMSPALMGKFYHLHKVAMRNVLLGINGIIWPFHHVTPLKDALLLDYIQRFASNRIKSILDPFVILDLMKEFHVQNL